MSGRTTLTAVALFGFAAPAVMAPATAQVLNAIRLTPKQEQVIIRMLTTGTAEEWVRAGIAGLVPLDERSPALREAMRDGLMRAYFDLGIRGGEDISFSTLQVAANADPLDIPVLARVTLGGPAAKMLYNWGHEATPHLIEAIMSPEVSAGVAGTALLVLAGIVTTHGTGGYGEALAEAAALHLEGPPPHYRSVPRGAMESAVTLAAVLRTPGLLESLAEIAASRPQELAERTGLEELYVRDAPRCARVFLDGVSRLQELPPPQRRRCKDPAALTDPDMFLDMVTNSPDGRGGDYWRAPVRWQQVPPWLRGS